MIAEKQNSKGLLHEMRTRSDAKVRLVLLARRKKSDNSELGLTGMTAISNTRLNPEGTILVDGELWRARSFDEQPVAAGSPVRVVGSKDYLLLVSAI